MSDALRQVHLGCGNTILEDYLNLDIDPPRGGVWCDFEDRATVNKVLKEHCPEGVDRYLASHVLEHVTHLMPLLEMLWEHANDGCELQIQVPHGASDDAWEDPTHVRPWFSHTPLYFQQAAYWRASPPDGYAADWAYVNLTYVLHEGRIPPGFKDFAAIDEAIARDRNVVREMQILLRAVKPARERLQELQDHPTVAADWQV
jgi:hypothetical protein